MKESDFRARLIKEFNPLRLPGRFIWAHDAHFKAGFPDLYWILGGGRAYHAELKLCKDQTLPADLWTLCTKIQRTIIHQLKQAGAEVHLIVAHAPPRGEKTVYYLPTSGAWKVLPFSSFWPWWASLTRF